DDLAVAYDLRPQHPLELGGRVGAMRAGGNQDGHILEPDIGQFGEDSVEHFPSRLRAGDVTDGNRDALIALDDRWQRPAVKRRAHRRQQRLPRIRGGRTIDRFDYSNVVVREFDLEAAGSVIELEPHQGWSGPCRARHYVAPARRGPKGDGGSVASQKTCTSPSLPKCVASVALKPSC